MNAAMRPRDRAIAEQAQASDPAVSAFVEASAGSGKTKLLTDRMLRLMLGGAHPAKIQCLTFTKAAAAEMALRLQHRLGEWVTLDDTALDARLIELQAAPTPSMRQTARALFAVVLDLPGGMRIGTIHAFCQGLLRRFPLEAAISPHFQLVDEVEAEGELRAAREAALASADPDAVAVVAGLLRAEDFASLLQDLQGKRDRLAPLLALPQPAQLALLRRVAGCEAQSDAEVLAPAVTWAGEERMRMALQLMQAHGSATVRTRAMSMLGWLSFPADQRVVHWADWLAEFYGDEVKPRGFGNFPNAVLDRQHPMIRDALLEEQERVWFIEDARRAVACVAATAALLRLAGPALDAYEGQKRRRSLLDYSDLVGRAERLLDDPGAAWVLYKLDGGIDHLLLDEVQDTAPEQWRIAHRLTEEFFAGLGTADDEQQRRTFFAVGDPKQSIYSFQGADPAEFVRSQTQMAGRVGGSGQVWRSVRLEVSFRSTAPVLALVDAVFADKLAADGVAVPGTLRHLADRGGHAGQVELWPLLAPPEKPDSTDAWAVPTENQVHVTAPQMLADGVARAIRTMLERQERLYSRGRALEPGDILILVPRRGPFATALVRALKANGVPVAGLDRMALTEQIAVQDLLAACDAVLLPEDDLAVACVLTSPLGGLSDDSLMELAIGRQQDGLFETLRARAAERPDWAEAWAFLSRLAGRADYGSPHALLTEALGELGGRARLLARLGQEAAEPIDELLNAALAYTRLHPPSLQGFVQWVRRSGAEVKREAGGAGSVVRVMTAHGAKGLQAPMVILPDTTALPPVRNVLAWGEHDGMAVPLWSPLKALRCAAVERLFSVADTLRLQERNRLLYVALTRAEDRLVVCGWQASAKKPPPDESWYAMVQRGFAALDADTVPAPWGGGSMMQVLTSDQVDAVRPQSVPTTAVAAPLPPWAGRPGRWTPLPAPAEPVLASPLAPSRPSGAAFGPTPPALSPAEHDGARFVRGTAVHALLQHLPALPEAAWPEAAAAYLTQAGVAAAERDALVGQVLAVLAHPALAPLFGPAGRAEQPLSGLVGGQVVLGVVDRMAVLPDRVVLADFKTGRSAPPDVNATPVRYVRQLAAYRAVLRALFPDRPVQCALVWTDGAAVTPIPDALLDEHAPRAA